MVKAYIFVVPSFFCKLVLPAGEYILFKIQGDVLHKALLVPFHLQDIVRFLIYDFFRYLLLGPHGIYCHHTAFQAQNVQQFRDGLNLVCFLIHLQLPQHKGRLTGPCAHHMCRTIPFCIIPAPADGFPVNGDNALYFPGNGSRPPEKGIMELFGVYHLKYPVYCIMGGYPARQFQK